MSSAEAHGVLDLRPGSSVGELRFTPTRSHVFMFSAITWNRHHIHYDKDKALAEGFPDVAVQRGLMGNYLARLMTNWSGEHGQLERLEWKVVKSSYPGQELCCAGQVAEVAEVGAAKYVRCALGIVSVGEQIAIGEARVRFAFDPRERKEQRQ